MPERLIIPPQHQPFIEQVRQTPGYELFRSHQVFNEWQLKNRIPQGHVGHGSYSWVIEDPQRKDIVHAINYDPDMDHQKMLTSFWLNKAFKTLFPYNFPRVYSIARGYVQDGFEYSGSVRERVYPAKKYTCLKYPFKQVDDFMEEVGNLPVYYENRKDHFILSEDGGQYYVDILELCGDITNSHIRKINNWIISHSSGDYQRKSNRVGSLFRHIQSI